MKALQILKYVSLRLKYAAFILLLCSAFRTLASPQMPDYIVYKGDTIATYNLLVEQYLQKIGLRETGTLFVGTSTNCWRGYQAIYVLQNDSLFLTDIINCGTIKMAKDKAYSEKAMKEFFGDKAINGKIYIDWFSGDLNFPIITETNKRLRWDGVFYTIFERETVANIS